MKIRARFNFFQVKATLGAGVQKIRMQQIRRILSNVIEYYRRRFGGDLHEKIRARKTKKTKLK